MDQICRLASSPARERTVQRTPRECTQLTLSVLDLQFTSKITLSSFRRQAKDGRAKGQSWRAPRVPLVGRRQGGHPLVRVNVAQVTVVPLYARVCRGRANPLTCSEWKSTTKLLYFENSFETHRRGRLPFLFNTYVKNKNARCLCVLRRWPDRFHHEARSPPRALCFRADTETSGYPSFYRALNHTMIGQEKNTAGKKKPSAHCFILLILSRCFIRRHTMLRGKQTPLHYSRSVPLASRAQRIQADGGWTWCRQHCAAYCVTLRITVGIAMARFLPCERQMLCICKTHYYWS